MKDHFIVKSVENDLVSIACTTSVRKKLNKNEKHFNKNYEKVCVTFDVVMSYHNTSRKRKHFIFRK